MRRILILIISVTGFINNCTAQKESMVNQSCPLTEVKDWGQRSMIIVDEVWNNIKDQLIAQIGEEGYNDVRAHYDYKSIPEQMSVYSAGKRKNLQELSSKLSTLKVFKIASYDHIFQGKNWGKYLILKCPYEENKNWDTTAKWDIVYFIIKEDFVK